MLSWPFGPQHPGAARERQATFGVLRDWLRAYSAKRSVLLVVEDLHWIDVSTLEFLGHFIREGPHERILTLLTFFTGVCSA